jgi:hypothetical protein
MSTRRLQLVARVLVAVGAAAIAAGMLHQPDRTWAGILIASFGLLTAGLGGLFFVALNYACGATWAVAIRRIPEAFAAVIPIGAAGMGLVFLLRPSIYPWIAEAGHLEGFKGLWLDPAFFFLRAAVYVALWIAFAALIVRTSRAQDFSGAPRLTQRNVRLSIAFIVVFALSFWLASFDWIMSLEPHWYSTIFGVYNFAGLFASALALMILVVLWMRRRGELADFITDSHVHDLGKLLFAFSTFWMYIWFSQYMLMWYANIPEESAHYVRRREGLWLTLFYLNVTLNWVVPFLTLLSRPAKRGRVLAYVAGVVLVGRWLDLYLMVWPPAVAGGPRVGLCELGPTLAAAGLFVLASTRAFERGAPVPLREPALAASLHYQS